MAVTDFDLEFLQPGETAFEDTPGDTTTGDAISCDRCGMPVQYAGTGRKPKRHKRGECPVEPADDAPETVRVPSPRRTGGRVSKEDRQAAADAQLAEDLLQGFGEVGGMVSAVAPMTGGTMYLRGPATVSALIRLSADYPGLRAGLEAVARMKPWSDIAGTAVALVYAAGVDAGRLPPYGMVAESLGVAEVARQMQIPQQPEGAPEYSEPTGQTFNSSPIIPRPPAFKPLGQN